MAQFVFVGLVTLGKDKLVYALTGAKLILSVGLDMLLVSDLSCSAKLGVNGIGYSNIIVNASLFVITLWLLTQNGVSVTDRAKMNFGWMKEFVRVGGISGLESFVRCIYDYDFQNGKYGRRAGNLLGCEQLYLGMAFTSDIEPWGFD